jgi:hypothetical protein
VLGTGWFGAAAAEAGPGKTVAVVGDGAVGLLARCRHGCCDDEIENLAASIPSRGAVSGQRMRVAVAVVQTSLAPGSSRGAGNNRARACW